MDSRTLMSKVYEMPEANVIDGSPMTFSPPLLKKAGDEMKVVFFVHIFSDTTPTDYVICDLNGENMVYLSADDAYELFQIRREDILSMETEGDGLSTGFDTGRKPQDIPEELYDWFDSAVFSGSINLEAYRDYVKELITYSDIAGKRYLKAFME